MKVMIVCSTAFYDKIDPIKQELERNGHQVITPNCYDEPDTNDDTDNMTQEEYLNFFRTCYYESREKVSKTDAILVLNYSKEKNGNILKNYIGASTFLEMYEAFMNDKKIFMLNDYPDNMLLDEIKGFNPIIINEDISKVQ